MEENKEIKNEESVQDNQQEEVKAEEKTVPLKDIDSMIREAKKEYAEEMEVEKEHIKEEAGSCFSSSCNLLSLMIVSVCMLLLMAVSYCQLSYKACIAQKLAFKANQKVEQIKAENDKVNDEINKITAQVMAYVQEKSDREREMASKIESAQKEVAIAQAERDFALDKARRAEEQAKKIHVTVKEEPKQPKTEVAPLDMTYERYTALDPETRMLFLKEHFKSSTLTMKYIVDAVVESGHEDVLDTPVGQKATKLISVWTALQEEPVVLQAIDALLIAHNFFDRDFTEAAELGGMFILLQTLQSMGIDTAAAE